jgi:hypothetical protein
MTQEERERAKKAREKRAKDYEAREKAKAEQKIEAKQKTVKPKELPIEPKRKMGFREAYVKPENFDKNKCSYWGTYTYNDEPKKPFQKCMVFFCECEWEGCNHQKEYLEENKLPLIPITDL